MSERKVGVFVCHCGGNISDYVDVERVRAAAAAEPGVVLARTHMFTCSEAAQQEMMEDIRKEGLDGLVVASCSPKLHQVTFRAMAERAGLNPYRYVHANIREQCSWTHTDDREAASVKAVRLVRAAIAKVRLTEPLERMRIETVPKVLVVGAGVAGMRAALGLADAGLAVFLVERGPEVGGWTRAMGPTFPTGRRGRDIVRGLEERLRAHENATVFTSAEVVERGGSVGDFSVDVRVEGGDVVRLRVGAILVTTGFVPYEPAEGELGYGAAGVVTLPQLLDDLHRDGSLVSDGERLRQIVYIYCVGSRQDPDGGLESPRTYCSRYCCTAAMHADLEVARLMPGVRQYHLYRDVRTYGRQELLYEKARRQGSVFLQWEEAEPPEVRVGGGRPRVVVKDVLTGGEEIELAPDLVVLVTGMGARPNDALVDVLKLPVGNDGFYNEIHPKLRPVETVIDGLLIAGAAQGPKTLGESVTSAMAAAAKVSALLRKGYVDLEPTIARVDTARCTWCGKCEELCPYGAIRQVEQGGKAVASILSSLCKGEGACVPACSEAAIEIAGYTDRQVTQMIDALAKEVA